MNVIMIVTGVVGLCYVGMLLLVWFAGTYGINESEGNDEDT